MVRCDKCGSEWFVSSPKYSFSPAQLAHYCSRTGRRETKWAESPAEVAMGDASSAASKANALAYSDAVPGNGEGT